MGRCGRKNNNNFRLSALPIIPRAPQPTLVSNPLSLKTRKLLTGYGISYLKLLFFCQDFLLIFCWLTDSLERVGEGRRSQTKHLMGMPQELRGSHDGHTITQRLILYRGRLLRSLLCLRTCWSSCIIDTMKEHGVTWGREKASKNHSRAESLFCHSAMLKTRTSSTLGKKTTSTGYRLFFWTLQISHLSLSV